MARTTSPLLKAIEKLDLQKFEALLAAGADPNQVGEQGMPVIFVAAIQRDGRFTRALIQAGAKVKVANELGETPLSYACSAEAAKAMIEAGADVNRQSRFGDCPLNQSVVEGLAKVVEVLLEHGANPNLVDRTSRGTCLHAAAFHKHPRVAQLLVAHGADLEARDENDRTPLWHAAFEKGQRSLDVAKVLIEAGADVNAADQEGDTPLMKAAQDANVPMTKLLLDAGAKPNLQDEDGHTALVWAVRDYSSRTAGDSREVIAKLLAAGADPDLRVSAQTDDPLARGKTARELAAANKDAKLRALFRSS